MSTSHPIPPDLPEWIERSIEGTITPQQWSQLNAAIESNEMACAFYVKYLAIYGGLACREGVLQMPEYLVDREMQIDVGDMVVNEALTSKDLKLASGLSEAEKRRQIEVYAREKLDRFLRENAPVAIPQRQMAPTLSDTLVPLIESMRGFVRLGLRATGMLVVYSAVIALVVLGIGRYINSQRTLATVVQQVQARWQTELPKDGRLKARTLRLEEGYARLRLAQGAEVLLQAPSIVTLKGRNEVYMKSGCVTAKVPKDATGFTIKTPHSSVVDYGTEFGLLVNGLAEAEVHVFAGRVGLGGPGYTTSEQQTMLKQGNAATQASHGAPTLMPLQDRAPLFAHSVLENMSFGIPGKRLSLADMVAGGNGLGVGTYGAGLYPANGAMIPGRIGGNVGLGQGFHPVPFLEFIDGVFVPDGGQGAITVSTTGTTFANGPDTLGQCHGGIISRAMYSSALDSSGPHAGQLAGRLYDTPQQPSIGMHANSGITIDLFQIRKTMAGVDIVKFHSLCGISSTVVPFMEQSGELESPKVVDFWVLVDGQQRFRQRTVAQQPECVEIDVPLQPNDRFLTLMTTTPGNISHCWGMLAEPYLELANQSR